ncbi:crAss001_48 related protein [Prevotella pallens]|uniref:crAss001_48 related protein n=1 Tax=Prevotella pallens TaxID=60133 RepID=UPI003C6E60FA
MNRMEFELTELTKRINKAIQACFTIGTLHWYKRQELMVQLEHMQKYADVLYKRIERAKEDESQQEERLAPKNVRYAKQGK